MSELTDQAAHASEWVVFAEGPAAGPPPMAGAPPTTGTSGVVDRDPLPTLRAALGLGFTLTVNEPRQVRRLYYDSFDGLVHRAGLTLCYESGQLSLASRSGDGEHLGVKLLGPPPAVLAPAKLADPRMRAALSAILGVRVCLVLAQATLRIRELSVLDELSKTVLRLELIEVAGLAPRVRLHALRGYEPELERVQTLFELAGGLARADEPYVDALARAAGVSPSGTSANVSVALRWDEPAQAAAAKVLGALGAIYAANLPGTITNLDHEFLHDLRVTIRRARTVVRELRDVFTADDYRQLSGELRWLQQVTGPSRDLDVQLDEFGGLADVLVEPLRDRVWGLERILRAQQRRAREQMERELKGPRVAALSTNWRALVDELGTSSVVGRPAALDGIGELAAERILKLYRRMVKMGKAIRPGSPPERYHDLRKQGKELRYMLELFGRPLFDARVIAPMITTLKGLQDVLGRHQDLDVQAHTLLALAATVEADEDRIDLLLAIGGLIQRFESDAASARGQFKSRFKAFASREQRLLVETTFGGDRF